MVLVPSRVYCYFLDASEIFWTRFKTTTQSPLVLPHWSFAGYLECDYLYAYRQLKSTLAYRFVKEFHLACSLNSPCLKDSERSLVFSLAYSFKSPASQSLKQESPAPNCPKLSIDADAWYLYLGETIHVEITEP